MAKKNPSDLTLRNLRAMKKQLVDLQKRVKALESQNGRMALRPIR